MIRFHYQGRSHDVAFPSGTTAASGGVGLDGEGDAGGFGEGFVDAAVAFCGTFYHHIHRLLRMWMCELLNQGGSVGKG